MTEKERSAKIKIAGEEYELLLTVLATKEIARRYGSLEPIAEKIYNTDDMATSLEETIWLVVLLANQSIAIHNLRNKDNPKAKLSTEEVELLISPYELADFKDAIIAAMTKGSERFIQSEEETAPKKKADE